MKSITRKKPTGQSVEAVVAEPVKIGDSTAYSFSARNLTAYGGLLPVATMLEKVGFQLGFYARAASST